MEFPDKWEFDSYSGLPKLINHSIYGYPLVSRRSATKFFEISNEEYINLFTPYNKYLNTGVLSADATKEEVALNIINFVNKTTII